MTVIPTLPNAVEAAMRAAGQIRADASTLAEASEISVSHMEAILNRLQAGWEALRPMMRYAEADPAAVLAQVEASRPGVAPADLFAEIAAARAAGAAIVAAVKGSECDPAGIAASEWDLEGARLLRRNFNTTQLSICRIEAAALRDLLAWVSA